MCNNYAIVFNIPDSFRARHLRWFFSDFCESNRFECFHYRHRPDFVNPENKSFCCVIRISEEYSNGFRRRYHRKHWVDQETGEDLTSRCLILKVQEFPFTASDGSVWNRSDFDKMIELNPPSVMERGNVGTSTESFLKLVHECRLPPSVIGKLRLEFQRSRKRRIFGNVPYQYYTGPPRLEAIKENNDDNDTCEEWERHEALHDDVSARRVNPPNPDNQPGTKERTFEGDVEVTWDKGSSGLVFYTDAQIWREQEAEAEDTDDWDVDTAGYYEGEESADRDAQDYMDMRRNFRFRTNLNEPESVFKRKSKDIGAFEKHTRGFGRKIMKRQGWREGQGLGGKIIGRSFAIDNEGQTDRTGLGYKAKISTAFDKPSSRSKKTPINRTDPYFKLSYRQQKH